MLISVLSFVVVFGAVVLVHEAGHFLSARQAGIKVLEFGIGFGPRIARLAQRDGVDYTLNLIPLGGFVRMLGEEDPSEPGSLASQSAWVRIRTLAAGSVMNLVLAAVLFTGVFMIGEQVLVGRVVVDAVVPDAPAEQAGILPGDVILALGGEKVESMFDLIERTQQALGREVSVTLLRGGVEFDVRATPREDPPAGQGALGITIGMAPGWEIKTVRYPPWEAAYRGVQQVWVTMQMMVQGLLRAFRVGLRAGDVTGPVGILQVSAAAAQSGLSTLMRWTALLSVNLFLVNMLPVPGLDGGRIAFVLLEKVRGRRMAPQREGLAHLIGILLLLAVMLVVSYFDIQRVLGTGSALP